ncbi:MAG: SpoIIE family protein phosphatase [Acidobacteria bacterium]|nr:SpoIIE family protein phosphatase [Acidobacteriota bacterium]
MTQASDNEGAARPVIEAVETLRTAIYHLSEGMIIADKEGQFLVCNQTARSILAIDSGNSPISWSHVQGWFHPDGTTPYSYHELPATLALAGAVVSETEIFVRNDRRPSGIWISVHANPLLNNQGEIRGSVVVFNDITQKKQADDQIRIMTGAVEQTADSIIITDNNAIIEYVNPAFEATTGFTKEESLGKTPMILKSGAHDDAFYRDLWLTILSGKVYRATLTNRKKNGEIFFAEQTITPMKDSNGAITHFVTVIKDVTELRKLQEQQFQINLARAVQQQFYRMPPPKVDGFDMAGAAFPADETGGDYFDFLLLPDNCIGIAIGDVSGHGVSSALLMAELRAYLRAFARQSSDIGEILSLVNDALVSDLELGRYATLIFCRLHTGFGTLEYANAGHTPGYILDRDGKTKRILESTDLPLGFLPNHKFGRSDPIALYPGDILALLTDGITDAEKPDQTWFGIEPALEFIHAHRQESAQEIVNMLFRTVRDFSEGLPQIDDITTVICKTTGGGK